VFVAFEEGSFVTNTFFSIVQSRYYYLFQTQQQLTTSSYKQWIQAQ